MDRLASKSVLIQPYTTTGGKEIGLVVHNVEEGSYVDRVGELQTADRITEINGIYFILLVRMFTQDSLFSSFGLLSMRVLLCGNINKQTSWNYH